MRACPCHMLMPKPVLQVSMLPPARYARSEALVAMASTLYAALSNTHHCEQVFLAIPKSPGCSEAPNLVKLDAAARLLEGQDEFQLTARLNLIACVAWLYRTNVQHKADADWRCTLAKPELLFDYYKEVDGLGFHYMANSLCLSLTVSAIALWQL